MESQNTNPETSEVKVAVEHDYLDELRKDQNIIAGMGAGVAAAIVGAILWAVITVVTGYQIGYMAICVGLLVGFAIRIAGKGVDQIFGIAGALLALIGCVGGNILSIVDAVATAEGLGYMQVLGQLDFTLIKTLLVETFNIMDLLFYGIAVYEGYKFSFVAR